MRGSSLPALAFVVAPRAGFGGRWVRTVRLDALAEATPRKVKIVTDEHDAWKLRRMPSLALCGSSATATACGRSRPCVLTSAARWVRAKTSAASRARVTTRSSTPTANARRGHRHVTSDALETRVVHESVEGRLSPLSPGNARANRRSDEPARRLLRRSHRAPATHTEMLEHPIAGSPSWARSMGFTLLFLLCAETVTGVALMTTYAPSIEAAWASVHFTTYIAPHGWLLRGVHRFAGEAMLVLACAHVAMLAMGEAHRRPREVGYIAALLAVGVIAAACITGAVLPWGSTRLLGAPCRARDHGDGSRRLGHRFFSFKAAVSSVSSRSRGCMRFTSSCCRCACAGLFRLRRPERMNIRREDLRQAQHGLRILLSAPARARSGALRVGRAPHRLDDEQGSRRSARRAGRSIERLPGEARVVPHVALRAAPTHARSARVLGHAGRTRAPLHRVRCSPVGREAHARCQPNRSPSRLASPSRRSVRLATTRWTETRTTSNT